jgi:hypothetical protein
MSDDMTHVNVELLKVLRDALREKGKETILTPEQYDAILHANAKIEWGNEHCSRWPARKS